jgi:SHAQKYF class myb-like DNA-binding protein
MKQINLESPSESSNRAGSWMPCENEKFVEALEKYGKNWSKISKSVGTRTPTQVKSRFQKLSLRLHKETKGLLPKTLHLSDELYKVFGISTEKPPETRTIGIQYGEGMYFPGQYIHYTLSLLK